jgi:EpsI family protein
VLTGIIVHRADVVPVSVKSKPLRQAIQDIAGWQPGPFSMLADNIVEELKLDDYVNQRFFRGNDAVNLYIGYYLTSKKIGAAHDPLVCFPGQGWQISDRATGKLQINSESDRQINYSCMVTELKDKRELVVYWFQSYDQTSPNTFLQKLKLLKNNITRQNGDNAFFRLTIPLQNMSVERAMEISSDFILAVYPVFLDFIING